MGEDGDGMGGNRDGKRKATDFDGTGWVGIAMGWDDMAWDGDGLEMGLNGMGWHGMAWGWDGMGMG